MTLMSLSRSALFKFFIRKTPLEIKAQCTSLFTSARRITEVALRVIHARSRSSCQRGRGIKLAIKVSVVQGLKLVGGRPGESE